MTTDVYIITNSNETKYIYQTQSKSLAVTTNKTNATKWNDWTKVNNVISNMPKLLQKDQWKVLSVALVTNNNVSPKGFSFPVAKPVDKDIIGLCSEIEEYSVALKARQQLLQQQLSIKDKEREDICHYIEFYNLNACQGYKIYKLLHQTLNERREIKNELEQINIFFTHIRNGLYQTMESQCDKKYTPKALPTLFADGV